MGKGKNKKGKIREFGGGRDVEENVIYPKLSVIVPVYNTEKYIENCLNSISRQTYQDMEVIVVNDGSTDGSADIIDRLMQKDKRIRCIAKEKNGGLFCARVTGVENSLGKYIAFVDSDDTVSVDWFRLLVKKAEETEADIVMGNTVCEDEKHNKYIYNTYYFAARSREDVHGEAVLDSLMENEGMCFSKHTVWNKLYSRRIWEQALPHFRMIKQHFVMTEDIAFSVVLHYYAKKLAYSGHDGYFYYRNGSSSTIAVNGLEKIKKNVKDLKKSFSFVKAFLQEKEVFEKYEKKYQNLKDRYFRWWSYSVKKNTEEKSKEAQYVRKDFLAFFGKTEFETPKEEDDFFTDAYTTWNGQYEQLKFSILDAAIEYVSFDIFDTLILRPFLEPTDLYFFMEKEFKSLVPGNLSFHEVRADAERLCRKNIKIWAPSSQDVTLQEIYEQMRKRYQFSEDVCRRLMKKEEELEIKFCTERKAGKELYEMAHAAGKKIILISDMYLEEETVNAILQKNGYTLHEKLFLSSTERYLKCSGDLFKIALQTCQVRPESMLHIGDNWNSDYLQPPKLGCKSFFLPKTKDILFNTLGDAYTGEAISATFNNINSIIDTSAIMKNPMVRSLYALAANELFDNPFVSFNSASNYNRDAYFVGYFTVGMHLLGIGRWMAKELCRSNYEKVHFIARDGYLPKKVYDIIRKYETGLPPSEYIYASRKSMIAASIRSSLDLYSIKENCSIYSQTPKSIYKLYADVLVPLDDEVLGKFKKLGILFDRKFANEEEFQFFVEQLAEIAYDKQRAEESYQSCSRYFKDRIGEADVAFDLGYSGKLQASVCRALGFPMDVLYLHSNGFGATQQARFHGYHIKSYYDFDTSMSGIVNEFIFSDYGPSCIGYRMEQGKAVPVFEEKETAYQEKYLLDEIARGCEKYVGDFYKIFQEQLSFFDFRIMETSLPYERFLMNPKWFDLNLLKCCYLEDEYYGGISRKRLSDHWWWQMNQRCLLAENMQQNSGIAVPLNADSELGQIYQDGVFVAVYRKINRLFPLGSRRREFLKKIGGKVAGQRKRT